MMRNTSAPCRYITVLREPVSRLVSYWNYFCLGCYERARMCPHRDNATAQALLNASNHLLPRDSHGLPRHSPKNSCPSMGIVDFVAWSGVAYEYTAMLGRELELWPVQHAAYNAVFA